MDKEKQRAIGLWFMLILIVAVVTEASLAVFLPLAFPTSGHFYLWNPGFAQVRRAWAADAGGSDDEIGWPSAQEDALMSGRSRKRANAWQYLR